MQLAGWIATRKQNERKKLIEEKKTKKVNICHFHSTKWSHHFEWFPNCIDRGQLKHVAITVKRFKFPQIIKQAKVDYSMNWRERNRLILKFDHFVEQMRSPIVQINDHCIQQIELNLLNAFDMPHWTQDLRPTSEHFRNFFNFLGQFSKISKQFGSFEKKELKIGLNHSMCDCCGETRLQRKQ